MVTRRSQSRQAQMCLFRKQLNFSAILTFGLAIVDLQMVSCHQGRMRPRGAHLLVGQKITMCCLHLISSSDTFDPRNASFTGSCPDSDPLMSEIYTAEENNEIKICMNVTISSTQQDFKFCECHYGQNSASALLQVDEPPSVAEDAFSCLLYDGIFQCSWTPLNIKYVQYLDLELLYQATHDCRSESGVSKVSCETGASCEIPIGIHCCYYYNVSLKIGYNTSVGYILFPLVWKEFYLPWISKYPTLPVEVKDTNENCITLGWRQQTTTSDFDVIQFEYISHWEPSKEETLNITIEWPDHQNTSCLANSTPFLPEREEQLCGLIPFTHYKINVRIRPSTSHVWSDPYSVKATTNDSVPAVPPPTISGAFKRISNNAAIIYWKLLSKKEWQSDQKQGTYCLFEWNLSSKEWQLLRSLQWNVSQIEIPLLEEQDTIIKLQAHNHKGYAKNYSEITIPLKGPSAPSNVAAVIYEAEKEVRLSWDSEFDEVVILWCIRGKKYQCLHNSFDWLPPQIVSSRSTTLHIKDLNPSLHYMFGVSASHLDVSSGIEWTNCSETINDLKTFKSKCSPSLYQMDTGNGNETQIVTIMLSTFAILIVISLILAVFYWWRKKWSLESKHLGEPSQKLQRAKSVTNPSFDNRDEDPPSENPSQREFVNDINISSDPSTYDDENPNYHRIRNDSSPRVTEVNEMTEISLPGNLISDDLDYHLQHKCLNISDHQWE